MNRNLFYSLLKMKIKQRKLSVLYLLISNITFVNPIVAQEKDVALKNVEVIADPITVDERGKFDEFNKSVSNLYMTRGEIENYRVNATGDLLKGLNGVYNMSTRTAGSAISPNIRGVAGKGRIPVTIDGTEQTVDVWLNNYGIADRNYIDPSMIRSIAVEKSPGLTRGLKTGVGGGISFRTIEADDIIKGNKNWGFQFSLEGANNANQPRTRLEEMLGKDYRTLGAVSGGVFLPDADNLHAIIPVVIDSEGNEVFQPNKKENDKLFKFKNDYNVFVAGAFKNKMFDVLAAYGYREKGNYFSGRKGGDRYLNNPLYNWEPEKPIETKLSSTFIPNIAKQFKPGLEVLNSNTSTESLLIKNNWYLPNDQKLGFQFMRTDVKFGEINPIYSMWILNYTEEDDYTFKGGDAPFQVQNLVSDVKTDLYKLSYSWKPQNNPYIDLKANLWRLKTKSNRHQSGGFSLATGIMDSEWDFWYTCHIKKKEEVVIWGNYSKCSDEIPNYPDINENTTVDEMLKRNPNVNGKFNVLSGAKQHTEVTRNGFDISNVATFNDKLQLLVGVDYQREYVDEKNNIVNSGDMFNVVGMITSLTKLGGPREGKRSEWGVNLALNYKPIERLKIEAGVRIHGYEAEDITLKKEREKRNPLYAITPGQYEKNDEGTDWKRDENGNPIATFPINQILNHVVIPYYELVTSKEEHDEIKALIKENYKYVDVPLNTSEAKQGYERYIERAKNFYRKYGHDFAEVVPYSNNFKKKNKDEDSIYYRFDEDNYVFYKTKYTVFDIKNNLPQLRPGFNNYIAFSDSKLNEEVSNLSWIDGKFRRYYGEFANTKYLNSLEGKHWWRFYQAIYDSYSYGDIAYDLSEKSAGKKRFISRDGIDEESEFSGSLERYNKRGQHYYCVGTKETDVSSFDCYGAKFTYVTKINPDDYETLFTPPGKWKGTAISPMIALTFDATDRFKLFTRYSISHRFPSLYEISGTSFVGYIDNNITDINMRLDPEKSTNYELGATYDFSNLSPSLRQADIRLTYFSNTIENVIDTLENRRVVQFEKKITKGFELLTRFDAGTVFGSLGLSYRTKQLMCDSKVSLLINMQGKVPECFEGGFGATKFYQALQPKYSLNFEVGTRLFNEKLEMGLRGIYHSNVDLRKYDDFVKSTGIDVYNWSQRPYHWKSELTMDFYAKYNPIENLELNLGVTNITDRYYLDPMSTVPVPGPGRTFKLGLKARF